MAEYRVIKNIHGFMPQRRYWYGWDNLTVTGGRWWSDVITCETVEDARAAIDADFHRRSGLDSWTEGAEIETYQPQPKIQELG